MTLKQTTSLGIVTLILFVFMYVFSDIQKAESESPSGTESRLDSATTTTIGPDGTDGGNAVTIFSKTTDCDARVITTRGNSAIMLSFGEVAGTGEISSSTLSGAAGHLQLASTTVEYNSGVYGCGRWSAYAWSTTTITVSEF